VVYGGDHPYTLVVEPWADEFIIQPDERCRVVGGHDTDACSFGVERRGEYLIVWINEGGATFEFWRNGQREA
jgi:hypothetical protein